MLNIYDLADEIEMEMNTMTENEIIEMVARHNKKVDDYINIELTKVFGTEITLNDWFKAQRMIQEQDFYTKGMNVLNGIRAAGYDVKMDMQSNKLVIPEYYELCIDKVTENGADTYEIVDTEIQLTKLTKEEAYEKFNLFKEVSYLKKGYAFHINYWNGFDWNEIEEYVGTME